MKQFARAFAAACLALAVAGCNLQTFQTTFTADVVALETKVAAFVAKVRAAYPVVLADVKTGIQAVCTIVPLGNSTIASVQANLSNPSDKVQNYLNLAATSGQKAQAACDKYNATQAANPTISDGTNTILAAWNAYQAAKQNLTSAQAALPPATP